MISSPPERQGHSSTVHPHGRSTTSSFFLVAVVEPTTLQKAEEWALARLMLVASR